MADSVDAEARAPAAAEALRLPIWSWLTLWLGVWVAGAAAAHYAAHGVLNGFQLALAFFLAINLAVTFWEISLYLRIDLIEQRYRERQERRRRGERGGSRSFFLSPAPLAELASPTLWSRVWSEYAKYDPSYADRRSFGFAIDVGNGFVTLVPSLVFLVGMTFPILSPVVLGIVGLLTFYQKFYGTLLYFFSYVFNRRYEGHSRASVWTFVGGVNGIWLLLPGLGLYVCLRLILDGGFDVLWR
jgi:hypothetical protein